MGTPIPKDAKKFRMSILPATVFIFFCGWVLGNVMGVSIFIHTHHWKVFWEAFLCSIPVLLFFAFLFALLISLAFPSYISAQGIHGHTFWGVRNFLGWTDIAQAKRMKLGNLTYVRLYSGSGGVVLWFPLFQSPQPHFQDEIRRLAPKDCPILNHIN